MFKYFLGVALILSVVSLHGQDRPHDREFVLGSGLSAVATQVKFSFYNDQLFRLVIAYDPQRTKGMTDADMIRALSDAYGPAVKPKSRATQSFASRVDVDSGAPIAR